LKAIPFSLLNSNNFWLLTGIKELGGLPTRSEVKPYHAGGHCERIRRSPDTRVISPVKYLDEAVTRSVAKTKILPRY
jgi:hypothetical protein